MSLIGASGINAIAWVSPSLAVTKFAGQEIFWHMKHSD